MDNLLLHAHTRGQLEAHLSHPAQSILIIAPAGSGKSTLARQFISRLLGVDSGKLDVHPYFFAIEAPAGKQEIPIDEIRKLIRGLNLRVPADSSGINRAVLIDRAHTLSTEAQNSLLKLLEEPPAATALILTAENDQLLLPTVLSRLQVIRVVPPELQSAYEFFKDFDIREVETAWRLSHGAAGLMASLLSDTDHPLRAAINDTKNFLRARPYERMLQLQEVSRDPTKLNQFLEALSLSLSALQSGESIRDNLKLQKKIISARKLVGLSLDARGANVNPKLLYLNLCLNFNL